MSPILCEVFYAGIVTDNLVDEPGDLTFPDNDASRRVNPGDNVEMVLETHRPVAAEAGQRFNIREGGRTVATGLITRVVE